MTNVISCETAIPADRARAIKARQQALWASADFAVIGATLQIVGELLNEASDVRSIHKVLDVAAGNGNATLAAARRFASVTSTDYVPALLERGRRRADAEGFANVTFDVADAEALPYPDASFDVVLSTFGVMFAPDHQRAAAELMRVCNREGRIGLANWTPAGFPDNLHDVEGCVRIRQRLGVRHVESDVGEPFGVRAAASTLEQRWNVVGGRHAGEAPRRRQRRVAVARGHIQYLVDGAHIRRFVQELADDLEPCADHGKIGGRPHCLLPRLDRAGAGPDCSFARYHVGHVQVLPSGRRRCRRVSAPGGGNRGGRHDPRGARQERSRACW
jgi:SAM-dependent methyltransferase